MGFICPICACQHYRQVTVRKRVGLYITEFFACQRCTVMFTDPDRFSANRAAEVVGLDMTRIREQQARQRAEDAER